MKTDKTAYRKNALSEDDDVHVQRLQIRWAEVILFETSETDEVVVPEELDLLAGFLGLDIFCRERMDTKDLLRISGERKLYQ